MAQTPKPKNRPHKTLGPVADLESHLPDEWWRELFDSVYLKTDGDVVENDLNTQRELEVLLSNTGITSTDRILDLCCGQGRHSIALAERGFKEITGIDRSRYLIRLARRRAKKAGLSVAFREGDARSFKIEDSSIDCVIMLGNSFGYFDNEEDDRLILKKIERALYSGGILAMDITDGDWMRQNYSPRSWEWIDQNHFVCRERSLTSDNQRLVTREVVTHAERGIIADQFYAERLYSEGKITDLLESFLFRNVRILSELSVQSSREQDLGMMANRMFITADAPRQRSKLSKPLGAKFQVAVVLGDPKLPDTVKLSGQFGAEDFETVDNLKSALAKIPGYEFTYFDNHETLLRDIERWTGDFIFNLCDEGFDNDALKELHVPAYFEILGKPYTGAGPASLAKCYDKSLVRSIAISNDISVPMETFMASSDQSATIPSTFPALLKPACGDSSIGITKHAVVENAARLMDYLRYLRETLPGQSVLIQEYLPGAEYSVALIGNSNVDLQALPVLQVDYSGLEKGLPWILGYESKWEPDSPYWNQIKYVPAKLKVEERRQLVEHSMKMFEKLDCQDYARFDYRTDAGGTIKLLEVNPNPGWCWDGKMNLMAQFEGLSYSQFLQRILEAAVSRLGLAAGEMSVLETKDAA
ncbi:MAG: methyltransferase domain-containing protein [Rhodospirillales bacterium]|nr:methyltransferase domain-containing protein [Rhodospirillales bacterium]